MIEPADRADNITRHLISFGRVLRRAGLAVGTRQNIDALRALSILGLRKRDDVYQALYSIFVTGHEQAALFDQAFHMFWRAPAQLSQTATFELPAFRSPQDEKAKQSRRVREAIAEEAGPAKRGRQVTREAAADVVLTYSATEVLRQKDFAAFSTEEEAQAKRLLAQMSWNLGDRKVRRLRTGRDGRTLDLRQTIRWSLRHQGELLKLARRSRTSRPRDLVVLCDISGSMERYSRMLLHFMHTVATIQTKRVETFVFGTRLTRITRSLKLRDVDDAVGLVAGKVNDWAGGTRIGESLREFNFDWARRVLRSSSVVLIISDGWDRGEIPLLEREIARLKRSCYRLIWLNPLLGYRDYEPLTRGIQVVLPHIDDFLPVHNLASIEQLGEVMAQL